MKNTKSTNIEVTAALLKISFHISHIYERRCDVIHETRDTELHHDIAHVQGNVHIQWVTISTVLAPSAEKEQRFCLDSAWCFVEGSSVSERKWVLIVVFR
jgi:hypothetical protein